MDDLKRDLAPLSERAWTEIETEAKRTLKRTLAARKLVDFTGPLGWSVSSIGLGRQEAVSAAAQPGVRAALRTVQPLVELVAPFVLDRREMENIDRGARDPDLQSLRSAARAIGMVEDRAVFHGYAASRIEGITEAAASTTLPLTTDYVQYPEVVAKALDRLRSAGIDGPYAIALGPQCFTGLTTTTTMAGYPVFEHVRRLLDGPLVWAPAVEGAVVVSLRGGDFELSVGRDFSVGYSNHTDTAVHLYLQESFTFRVLAPEAAVPLAYS
ncbi:Encapsulating protein for a DyP-type peroxidase or ferritin-like protein oligomers [Thioalkalivibrio nitratireducens DSM 14787]|uniref:Encapsulating protein for a DyP-type peroxidase or ferritin-like protein oligomers n=1 Tax=Thioalkalivibrio nitratireducens (strain DSM 14787 / UNIQEM 213 / ALEN2) TaxID=1255043 RepID=L0DR33_THIND|nr:family 1 encapsulin nanocompartment shell protein [Thioalkalivibrio nitratireducens]AGA32039.1 Encapsulating protein for a DyP-type peroxidase or ferritin-like protein oligomers [Thioalkalivibrio nitratireducens DSM 14787]